MKLENTGAIGVHNSPFVEVSRKDWAELAPSTALALSESDLVGLRGLGDRLDLHEVDDVYMPLSRLLSIYASGAQNLPRATSNFLGERAASTPFVIGVAGSVAVGKSTVARLLKFLLAKWEVTPVGIVINGTTIPFGNITCFGESL